MVGRISNLFHAAAGHTRQACVSAAFIFMAAVAAIAITALASRDLTQDVTAKSAAHAGFTYTAAEDTARDAGEEMVVKFTSTVSGRESVVTIPAVDLRAIGQAEDSITIEELIVGMRIIARRPPVVGDATYDLHPDSTQKVRMSVLKHELNNALRRYAVWSPEEETRLRDVLAMFYPKLVVLD